MKTGKTPYEIRLDLLVLAHKVLTQKAEAEAGLATEQQGSEKTLIIKTYPTTEEIIEEARKLNGFVSGT